MGYPTLVPTPGNTGAARCNSRMDGNYKVPRRNGFAAAYTGPARALLFHPARRNKTVPDRLYIPSRWTSCDFVRNWLCLPYTYTNPRKKNTITMKHQRVKAGFIRYPDAELLVAAGRIMQAMKNSLVFTDPRPSLAEIETAFVDYQQKVYAAGAVGSFTTPPSGKAKADWPICCRSWPCMSTWRATAT